MSLKDALNAQTIPDLAGVINNEFEQVEAKELVITRESSHESQ